MNILTQRPRTAAFLLSEGAGEISREQITLAPTDTGYPSGQLLGVVTASKQYAAYDSSATDGTENAVAILYDYCEASTNPQPATAIVRLAEVAAWGVVGLDAEARTAIDGKLIIVRD